MVSFNKIPYGFQKRLAQLAPIDDIKAFQLINPETYKLTQRTVHIRNILCDQYCGQDTVVFDENQIVTVTAQESLNLCCMHPDKYTTTLQSFHGSYSTLTIRGKPYPWQLFIGLIRPTVRKVELRNVISLGPDEIEQFANELFTTMTNQRMRVTVYCKNLQPLIPVLRNLARNFMHHRRKQGLSVAYIQVSESRNTIESYLEDPKTGIIQKY